MSLQSLIKHHFALSARKLPLLNPKFKKENTTDFPDILFSKTRLQHDVGIPDVELAVAGLVVGDRLEVLFKRKKATFIFLGKACIVYMHIREHVFFFLSLCMSQCSYCAATLSTAGQEIRRLIIKVGQGSEYGVAEREKMMAFFLAAKTGK